jgi:hypothetical protein
MGILYFLFYLDTDGIIWRSFIIPFILTTNLYYSQQSVSFYLTSSLCIFLLLEDIYKSFLSANLTSNATLLFCVLYCYHVISQPLRRLLAVTDPPSKLKDEGLLSPRGLREERYSPTLGLIWAKLFSTLGYYLPISTPVFVKPLLTSSKDCFTHSANELMINLPIEACRIASREKIVHWDEIRLQVHFQDFPLSFHFSGSDICPMNICGAFDGRETRPSPALLIYRG